MLMMAVMMQSIMAVMMQSMMAASVQSMMSAMMQSMRAVIQCRARMQTMRHSPMGATATVAMKDGSRARCQAFTFNGNEVERVQSYKYLGFEFHATKA